MKAGVALLLGFLFTVNAFAQGTVDFQNTPTTRLTTNTFGAFPPPPNPYTSGLGRYTIGLYIAPQGTTDPGAFTLMGPTTLNQSGGPGGAFNGRFNGNPGPTSFVISNNTGQTIAFQVRAWSTAAGSTYEMALSSGDFYLGSSTIGQVTPAIGLGLPPALFGTNPGQVGGFVLGIVPEPSSTALVLAGAAAFGLWRLRFRLR